MKEQKWGRGNSVGKKEKSGGILFCCNPRESKLFAIKQAAGSFRESKLYESLNTEKYCSAYQLEEELLFKLFAENTRPSFMDESCCSYVVIDESLLLFACFTAGNHHL
jgi:hypothetical protein